MNSKMRINQKIVKFSAGMVNEIEDYIVTEYPLTIFINGQEFATLVCTPSDMRELIFGFLASEGVIRFADEIVSMSIDEAKGLAYVDLTAEYTTSQQFYSKRFIGSCCGKGRQFYFQNDAKTAKTSTSKTTITAEQCLKLMKDMQEDSVVFHETGGVHNAALCKPNEMIIKRTDIGRHNALDKIYGYALLSKTFVRDKIIVISGRISSEILLKAAKIGVGIILSKSAPTNLAIKLAEELNITVVGFIRGHSFNVYSHSNRIKFP